MAQAYKLGSDDKDPVDPFTRVVNMNTPLNLPRETPLRDVLPGIMTYGQMLDLVEKYHRKS